MNSARMVAVVAAGIMTAGLVRAGLGDARISGAREPIPSESLIHRAVASGVQALSQAQHADGIFPMDWCADRALTRCRPDPQTAVTGAVMRSLLIAELAPVPPEIPQLIERGLHLLLAEQLPDGLWPMSHLDHHPPAIHDICVNALALHAAGRPIDRVVAGLLAQRQAEGTFDYYAAGYPAASSSSMEAAHFADPVVNAAALHVLTVAGRQEPALCAAVNAAVADPTWVERSRFYRSVPLLAYTVSGAYEAGARCLDPAMAALRATLIRRQQRDGSWGSALDTAFAVSALTIMGARGVAWDRAMSSLLSAQLSDGVWPADVVFEIPEPAGYYSSAALTTAVAIEALTRVLRTRVSDDGLTGLQ